MGTIPPGGDCREIRETLDKNDRAINERSQDNLHEDSAPGCAEIGAEKGAIYDRSN